MTERELSLRREIIWAFTATGEPPREIGDPEALVELERRHIVVVRDGRIHMAHPFAGHHDGTRVEAEDGRTWWGNCAWDGLGIVAALGLSPAVVTSGDVTLHVRDGQVLDDALFQVRVPARHWWDDIEYACATMRLLRSEEEIEAEGEVMDIQQLQVLASAWYGDRLDPDWRPRTRDESQRLLAAVGLDGPFWELPG